MLMRNWLKIVVFIAAMGVAEGQTHRYLSQYTATGDAVSLSQAEQKLTSVLEKIGSKAKKSDRQFLKTIFAITHRQVLKQYSQYASFDELLRKGSYDCLTATAFYSLVLSAYGYEHTIVETNFHIFLLVKSEEGEVLFESTDPIAGFEYQAEKIKKRVEAYLADQVAVAQQSQQGVSYSIFDSVSADQLTGLLYYNQCVKAFNQQQWMKAGKLLTEAKRFYNSPRIAEMENLLNVIASAEKSYTDLTLGASQLASRNP